MDYIEQLNKKIKNNDIKNLSKIKKWFFDLKGGSIYN
jgi:hypothetical protein